MYQLATFQINRCAGRTDGDRMTFFAPKQDVKGPNSSLKKPFLLLFCAICAAQIAAQPELQSERPLIQTPTGTGPV
jgi:hypothetical protein